MDKVNIKTKNSMQNDPNKNKESNSRSIKGIIPEKDKKTSGYPLLFARHGNTALNEDGDKIRGWKDVPLSPKGLEEVKRLGEQLKSHDFDGIISSDLKRAQQTAEAISKATGKPILGYTKALRPLNAGVFQGQESNKILSKLSHYIEHPDEKIPEGESFNDFKNRYLTEVQNIKSMFPDKTMLIVAHHRNNVCLDAWLADGEKPNLSVDNKVLKEKGIPPADFKIYML